MIPGFLKKRWLRSKIAIESTAIVSMPEGEAKEALTRHLKSMIEELNELEGIIPEDDDENEQE